MLANQLTGLNMHCMEYVLRIYNTTLRKSEEYPLKLWSYAPPGPAAFYFILSFACGCKTIPIHSFYSFGLLKYGKKQAGSRKGPDSLQAVWNSNDNRPLFYY